MDHSFFASFNAPEISFSSLTANCDWPSNSELRIPESSAHPPPSSSAARQEILQPISFISNETTLLPSQDVQGASFSSSASGQNDLYTTIASLGDIYPAYGEPAGGNDTQKFTDARLRKSLSHQWDTRDWASLSGSDGNTLREQSRFLFSADYNDRSVFVFGRFNPS